MSLGYMREYKGTPPKQLTRKTFLITLHGFRNQDECLRYLWDKWRNGWAWRMTHGAVDQNGDIRLQVDYIVRGGWRSDINRKLMGAFRSRDPLGPDEMTVEQLACVVLPTYPPKPQVLP